MKTRYKTNKKVMRISEGFTASIISIYLLFLSSILVNSYAQNEKISNLTKTNIANTLFLMKSFADGNEIFYITTKVSDNSLANYLSNLTNSRVAYSPASKYAPELSLVNIYDFY